MVDLHLFFERLELLNRKHVTLGKLKSEIKSKLKQTKLKLKEAMKYLEKIKPEIESKVKPMFESLLMTAKSDQLGDISKILPSQEDQSQDAQFEKTFFEYKAHYSGVKISVSSSAEDGNTPWSASWLDYNPLRYTSKEILTNPDTDIDLLS